MDEVTVELRRLWRLPTGSRVGRPAVLDVDRVVTAAIGLADRDGLSGVTLPKVADQLEVTPMSLYRHVGSKAELLELMRDHAGGPAPDIGHEQGWRPGLRDWAMAQRELFERHGWLAQLPVSGPPSGPNAVSWMEACLQTLRGTGLDWGAKLGVLALVGGFVRSASQTRQQLAEGRRSTDQGQAQAEQAYGMALARLVDPETSPETATLFHSLASAAPPEQRGAGGSDPDPDFTFGLEVLLDGVAAAIQRADGTAG
jgi:AcrR family transcriptional regulator